MRISNPIAVRENPPSLYQHTIGASLTEFILNIFFGIYGSIKLVNNQKIIKELEWKQTKYQSKAKEALEAWENLEDELERIRAEIAALEPATRNERFHRFKNSINSASQRLNQNLQFFYRDNRILPIVTDAITFLGVLLANIATLGMYSVKKNCELEKRISLLKWQNGEMRATYCNQFVTDKARQLSERVNEFAKIDQLNVQLQQLEAVTLEDLQGQMEQIRVQVVPLQGEFEELSRQDERMRAVQDRLLNEKNSAERELKNAKKNLKEREKRKEAFEKERAHRNGEIALLQERVADHSNIMKELEAAVARTSRLMAEINKFKGMDAVSDQIKKSNECLGPVPARYKKREEDVAIRGANGINEEDEDDDVPFSEYSQRSNASKTAVGIVQPGLAFAIRDLLGRPTLHLNEIAFDRHDPSCQRAKQAILRRLAWDFIENGQLEENLCHGFILKLNSENVTMGCSYPERVQAFGYNPASRKEEWHVRTVPTNYDDFTPSFENNPAEEGIDPASAKWIFAQLSENEKKHLFHLLMEPLIANDDVDLIAALGLTSVKGNERVELIKTAYILFDKIATAIDQRFSAKGLLDNQWNLLNGQNATFKKEAPLYPILGTNRTGSAAWEPNTEAIAIEYTQGEFLGEFFDAQLLYARMFELMSNELVEVPSPAPHNKITIAPLNQQYYMNKDILHDGCSVFSALLYSLMSSRGQINPQNLHYLKNALAHFLTVSPHRDVFERKIRDTHRIDLEQYQRWLRGEITLPQLQPGELEIEIAAHTFGIQMGLIVEGERTKLNPHQLLVPADDQFYFGPPTAGTLLIYKTENMFVSLWPKLKSKILKKDDEQTMRSIMTYRTSIQG